MAIGFPAYHIENVEISVSRKRARDAAASVFDLLDWRYEIIGPDLLRAHKPVNPLTWGETITVSFADPGMVVVRSACSFPLQCIDWVANRRNVDQFIARFVSTSNSAVRLYDPDPDYIDQDGSSPVERLLNSND